MSDPHSPPPSRVFVIGLDGATFRLITPLMQKGELPNLARIMQDGISGVLRSTIQPSSEQAWASFMTGLNNGKHGVYGFQKRRPGSYQFEYVNGASISGRTLWRTLSDRGRRVIVMNVPMTYPVEAVNGVLVGGLLSPGVQSRFTHPSGVYDELYSACGDYMIDVDIERGRLDETQLLALAEDAIRMIRLRTCAARHLGAAHPWDFFMVMYGASDRLAHKFWKYWDAQHPLHDPAADPALADVLPRIYRELDAAVGELCERFCDEHTTLFILSDHGFGPMEKAVYLNRWLAQKGYLVFTSGLPATPRQQAQRLLRAALRRALPLLELPLVSGAKKWAFNHVPALKGALYSSLAFAQIDWSRTTAYALGTMGNIYLNLRGREPQGIVEPGEEAGAVVERLLADLAGLRDPDTGEAVFHSRYRGADLYHGPHLHEAPDVVGVKDCRYHVVTADWQDGGEIVARLGEKMHFASDQSGQHDLDGILLAAGPGMRAGETITGARLLDMAPTLFYTLGEPVPPEMDGAALTGLFRPDWLAARPPLVAEAAADPGQSPGAGGRAATLTGAEAEAIRQRLSGLGYLD